MNPAKFIVDLYECRARIVTPRRRTYEITPEEIHEIAKYNWLNAIIAQLTDKYEVSYEEIEDEIRERRNADLLTKPNDTV